MLLRGGLAVGAAGSIWLCLRTRRRKTVPAGATSVVVLGLGYCGGAIARHLAKERGCLVVGTSRSDSDAANVAVGIRTIQADQRVEIAAVLRRASLIVATAPPAVDAGDPFLAQPELAEAIVQASQQGALVVYLSSVGIYGEQHGARVTEDTPPAPRTARAKRRLHAEEAWRALLPAGRLAIVRLPGIYGPNRGPLAKAREGNQRIKKEGHVFSRIHVNDVVRLCDKLFEHVAGRQGAGYTQSQPCLVINCCDSDPAPQHEVTALAYEILGRPVPPAVDFGTAELSAMQRSFYEESRLMDNQFLLSLVGSLCYESYKSGLPACLAAEQDAAARQTSLFSVVVGLGLRVCAALRGALSGGQVQRVALIDNGSLRPEATLSLRRLAQALEKFAAEQGVRLHVDAVSARFADRVNARELEGRAADVLPKWLDRLSKEARPPPIVLLPLLIGPSDTLLKALPAAARASGLDVDISPSLVCLCPALTKPDASGAADFAAMLQDRLQESGYTGSEHVILCDHGSPVSRVAAAREAVRVQLAKRLGTEVAGCCMERREGPEYDFNGLLLEDALAALPQGACARVALLFLQEGKHAGAGGDIASIVATALEKRPDLTVFTTKVLAGHPTLISLLFLRLSMAVPLRLWA